MAEPINTEAAETVNPIIERAARALSASNEPDGSEDMWPAYQDDARAVLRAIREPSVEMIEEGYASYDANGGSIRDAFMDMIDAALGEE